MKTLIQLVFVLLVTLQIQAQEKTVETKSVTIEDLIPFVVENFGSVTKKQTITFLIETTQKNFTTEENILLKQALKYVSEHLLEDATISILAYNVLNGIALEQTSVKNDKKILNALNNFSSHIHSITKDGITQAYNYAQENYVDNTDNIVVMVRNPNGTKAISPSNIVTNTVSKSTTVKKKNSSMVLLTAIAVLPELLSIIKD